MLPPHMVSPPNHTQCTHTHSEQPAPCAAPLPGLLPTLQVNMFAQFVFTCNFWGGWCGTLWDGSILTNIWWPRKIMGKPNNPYAKRLRVQQELLQHTVRHAKVWQKWLKGAQLTRDQLEAGWQAMSQLSQQTHDTAHGTWGTDTDSTSDASPSLSMEPRASKIARRQVDEAVRLAAANGVSTPPNTCMCGDVGCSKWPDCVNALASLLSQAPAKRRLETSFDGVSDAW